MVKGLVRGYNIRDITLVSIIRGDSNYRRMAPDDVLARIINHEFLLVEAKYVKNLSNSIVSTKKDNIALKASKKKQVIVESSSEEEQEEDDEDKEKEYDEEEMTLFIKKFNKYMSKRRPFKGDNKVKKGVLQWWKEWTLYCSMSI
jgi:hypothetical protein